MKKKYLYSLLIAFGMLGIGPLSSCDNSKPQQTQQNIKPKKHVKVIYKRPDLKFRVDTIDVTDDNLKELSTRGAGGVYFSGTNTVTVKYYRTKSKNAMAQRFCKANNELFRLNKRHEMEHARKYDYVHNKEKYSPFTRAKIAAMNETMAPASEIIEAMDYRFETGQPYPCRKAFIAHADSAIMSIIQKYNLSMPVNYRHPMIADAVLEYALESFSSTVNRGYYVHTMRKAYEQPDSGRTSPLIPVHTSMFYDPEINLWGPLWTFQTFYGDVDIYNSASFIGRQRLIDGIDSIVSKSVGLDKNLYFNRFAFMR